MAPKEIQVWVVPYFQVVILWISQNSFFFFLQWFIHSNKKNTHFKWNGNVRHITSSCVFSSSTHIFTHILVMHSVNSAFFKWEKLSENRLCSLLLPSLCIVRRLYMFHSISPSLSFNQFNILYWHERYYISSTAKLSGCVVPSHTALVPVTDYIYLTVPQKYLTSSDICLQ